LNLTTYLKTSNTGKFISRFPAGVFSVSLYVSTYYPELVNHVEMLTSYHGGKRHVGKRDSQGKHEGIWFICRGGTDNIETIKLYGKGGVQLAQIKYLYGRMNHISSSLDSKIHTTIRFNTIEPSGIFSFRHRLARLRSYPQPNGPGTSTSEEYEGFQVRKGLVDTGENNGWNTAEGLYKNGTRHGKWYFFQGGHLVGHCRYENGLVHGMAYYYGCPTTTDVSNIKKRCRVPYVKGVPHGWAYYWNRKGELFGRVRFKFGEAVKKRIDNTVSFEPLNIYHLRLVSEVSDILDVAVYGMTAAARQRLRTFCRRERTVLSPDGDPQNVTPSLDSLLQLA